MNIRDIEKKSAEANPCPDGLASPPPLVFETESPLLGFNGSLYAVRLLGRVGVGVLGLGNVEVP